MCGKQLCLTESIKCTNLLKPFKFALEKYVTNRLDKKQEVKLYTQIVHRLRAYYLDKLNQHDLSYV